MDVLTGCRISLVCLCSSNTWVMNCYMMLILSQKKNGTHPTQSIITVLYTGGLALFLRIIIFDCHDWKHMFQVVDVGV